MPHTSLNLFDVRYLFERERERDVRVSGEVD